MRGARPGKDLRQEGEDDLILVPWIALGIGVVITVVRLVPHIPGKDAGIVRKGANDALDVALQPRILRWIGENLSAGGLYPTGVVHAGGGRMLRPEFGMRIPAGVEEHKDGADMMAGGDGQEGVDSLLKALRILLPQQIMQKDSHGVHADALGPAQLAVNRCGVE